MSIEEIISIFSKLFPEREITEIRKDKKKNRVIVIAPRKDIPKGEVDRTMPVYIVDKRGNLKKVSPFNDDIVSDILYDDDTLIYQK